MFYIHAMLYIKSIICKCQSALPQLYKMFHVQQYIIILIIRCKIFIYSLQGLGGGRMATVYIPEVDQFYEESCRVYDQFICKPLSLDIHVHSLCNIHRGKLVMHSSQMVGARRYYTYI